MKYLKPYKRKLYDFLRASQRYTRTDMVYLFKGSSWLGIGQAVASTSGLALTLGLVTFLEKSEYGTYSYIMSVSAIVASLTLTGISTSVISAIANGKDKTLLAAVRLKLLWSIPATLGAMAFGAYYFWADNFVLGAALVAVGLFTPLVNTLSLYGAYYNGKKNFRTLVTENATRSIVVTVSVLAVAYFTQSVLFVIFAFLILTTLINGLFFLHLYRKIRTSAANTEVDTDALRFGKHLSLISILGAVANQADRILLFQFVGAAPLAAYSIAQAPVKELNGFTKISRTLSIPKFSQRSISEIKKTIFRKMATVALFSALLTGVYILAAPILFQTLFPAYTESIFYTQLIALGLLFMPFNLITQILTAHGAHTALYQIQIIKAFSKLLLFVALIPTYGIIGAIASVLLTHTLVAPVLVYHLIQRH